MAYIGPEPNPGQNREVDDISSGFNGSEVNFTLQVNSQNVSPGSPNNIIVSVGGVVQNPSTDYNIAASTITFTTAPASGLSFFGVVLGQQVDIQSLADGTSPTMSAPSITGDLSIADKIVHSGDTNTAIRFPAADTVTAETGGVERLRVTSAGKVNIGDIQMSSNLLNIEDGTAAAIDIASHGSGGDTAYIGVKKSTGGGLTFGISNRDIIFKTDASYSSGTTFDSGTERFRIDSNGFCSQPFKYQLVVNRSGDVSGYDAAGSFGTALIFNNIVSENKDSALSSCFDTSNGLFTVPVEGIYFLEASVFSSGTNFSQAWFTVSGSRASYSDWVMGSSGNIVNANNMRKLSASATVGFHPHGGGGQNNQTINASANHTWMRITFIG